MTHQAYAPVLLGIMYVSLREKYFPQYSNNHFDVKDFIDLGKLLEKERVHPQKYIEFVLGVLNTMKPTAGKNLANPILVQKYKAMTIDS